MKAVSRQNQGESKAQENIWLKKETGVYDDNNIF
jgi:hypothetical protein